MNSLFAQLVLADIQQDVPRNIVSIEQSQDLFDDLTDDSAAQAKMPMHTALAEPRFSAITRATTRLNLTVRDYSPTSLSTAAMMDGPMK